VRSSLPWRYDGVLPEHIACDAPHSSEKIVGLVCRGFFDGARNVDPRAKYQNDARVLEEALAKEPENKRYVFYLAQSHRDAGNLEKAVEVYRRRVELGGWAEEVWYSLLQIAALLERLGDFSSALHAYLEAYQYRPSRAEPLCALARHYRLERKYALAHLFAVRAANTPRPDDILFLDESVYDWRAVDELSIASYYLGDAQESLKLTEALLNNSNVPPTERARLERNLEFSRTHPSVIEAAKNAGHKGTAKRKGQRGKGKRSRRR
jgi:tetratricopeptide (TPR) repeat protein